MVPHETLLPPNTTALEEALELSVTERLNTIPHILRNTANPDKIASVWLPWLAWAWRVENWDSQWNDIQKRQSIKTAYSVHRKKGTIGAIREALNALGVSITVVEWFQETPRKRPYTFRLAIEPRNTGLSSTQWDTIRAIVNTTKNARSHLSGIDVHENIHGEAAQSAVCSFGWSIALPATKNHPDALTHHLSASTFGYAINLQQKKS